MIGRVKIETPPSLLNCDGTLPATTFTAISRSHLHSSGLTQVNMLTAATPRYGYPLCWARGYGMFKWLRWRGETTRTVAEVANRIVARSSDRGEPPADPDQVEELVGPGRISCGRSTPLQRC